MKGYPRRFLSVLVAAMLLVLATGLLLAPTALAMRADIALPWRLPGGARVAVAALHAIGGFAMMALAGAIWSVHMRSGWRRRKHRGSGLTLAVALPALAASAIALYYAGDDGLGALAALLHLAVGVLLTGQFGWHWMRGQRSRQHRKETDPGVVARRGASCPGQDTAPR